MKENSRDAWMTTVAVLLVLFSSLWEAIVSLFVSILLMVLFALYKNSKSTQSGKARAIIYGLLALIVGFLDWGAVRSLAMGGTQEYWSYAVLGMSLVMVYLGIVWEQQRAGEYKSRRV